MGFLSDTFAPIVTTVLLGVSGYIYFILCQWTFTIENGPLFWVFGWGGITVLCTYAWLLLLAGRYTEEQKARLMRSITQDNFIVAFMLALTATLHRADMLKPGTVGEPVVYLFPSIGFVFTLNSKYLTHIWVSTPFHTTWWCEGQMPKFAESEAINFLFSLLTILITLVLTSYATYAVLSGFGTWAIIQASLSLEKPVWQLLASHGTIFIWHSGMWMAASSSGSPAWAKCMGFMEIPPFLPANPHECIPVHIVDLCTGVGLLFIAALLKDDLSVRIQSGVQIALGMAWTGSFLAKVRVHYNGIGWTPKVKVE